MGRIEEEKGEKRERGIDSVSAPIGHHSLTPIVAIWEGQTSLGERPSRPVCYFKIVIRPPSPPSSVLAVNTPLDRQRPVSHRWEHFSPLQGAAVGLDFSPQTLQSR